MDKISKKHADVPDKEPTLDIQKMRRDLSLTETAKKFKTVPSLQILLMFDITGSMFKYFDLIRKKLQEIAQSVKEIVPSAQFAVFAYRNHGDEERHEQIFYSTPLTPNIKILSQEIQSIKKGGGGDDALTCLEDCLVEANSLGWNKASAKTIVVIGDMPPHGVIDSFGQCPNEIDYRDEVNELISKNVTVYSVFCGKNAKAKGFFRWLANKTGGRFLNLDQIDILKDILVAICMKQTGNLAKHLSDLRQKKMLTREKEEILLLLQ